MLQVEIFKVVEEELFRKARLKSKALLKKLIIKPRLSRKAVVKDRLLKRFTFNVVEANF